MIGTHITADNREIPIICLNDSHLINIIKLRIVKPFDLYESSLKVSPKLHFHLGKNVKAVEKPDVRKLIQSSIYYISEALRRNETRQEVLGILGRLDEDFGNPCQLAIEPIHFENLCLEEEGYSEEGDDPTDYWYEPQRW